MAGRQDGYPHLRLSWLIRDQFRSVYRSIGQPVFYNILTRSGLTIPPQCPQLSVSLHNKTL